MSLTNTFPDFVKLHYDYCSNVQSMRHPPTVIVKIWCTSQLSDRMNSTPLLRRTESPCALSNHISNHPPGIFLWLNWNIADCFCMGTRYMIWFRYIKANLWEERDGWLNWMIQSELCIRDNTPESITICQLSPEMCRMTLGFHCFWNRNKQTRVSQEGGKDIQTQMEEMYFYVTGYLNIPVWEGWLIFKVKVKWKKN